MRAQSFNQAAIKAWAIGTNQEERLASLNASAQRLRLAVALSVGILLLVISRGFGKTNADVPTGTPDATIDLATKAGVDLVKGQWRYSDTRIVETDFKAPGADKQPTGPPIKTYDYEPHAGGVDF